MAEQKLNAAEKGNLLCESFTKLRSNFPEIHTILPEIPYRVRSLTNELGQTNNWDYFVQFPKELVEFFPGSYISPENFLKTLEKEDKIKQDVQRIVDNKTGSAEDPAFIFEKEGFQIKVLNGLSNEEAMLMSYEAMQVANKAKYPDGFADEEASTIRVLYQEAMHSNIQAELDTKPTKNYAIRIHDDCLASGDSIVSYLANRMKDDGELKKMRDRGVSIVIDGPGTAQGILYLQALSKAKGIPINITVGHMAFGLNAGVEEDGVLKHANYITYPTEKDFLELLPSTMRDFINSITQPDGQSYVVGDMGEAEKGIDPEKMKEIRSQLGSQFCPWNEKRQDTHGPHGGKGITIQAKTGSDITDYVYFARGGYLPFAFDLMHTLSSEDVESKANVVIVRASRLFVIDEDEYGAKLGYGAGFAQAEDVTTLSPLNS